MQACTSSLLRGERHLPASCTRQVSRRNKQGTALFAAGVAGSLTNTLLVMNLIYFLFGDQYASAASWTAKWVYGVILGIIGMQGVPEALVAGIIVTAVAGILLKLTPDIRG